MGEERPWMVVLEMLAEVGASYVQHESKARSFPDQLAELLSKRGLYAEVEIAHSLSKRTNWVDHIPERAEYWCALCHASRPYELAGVSLIENTNTSAIVYVCLGCHGREPHTVEFYLREYEGKLRIVGMHPSSADALIEEHARYADVLSREDLGDLRKSVGLYSHGIGAAALLYLRRILERFVVRVEDTVYGNSSDPRPPQLGRFMDRIQRIEAHLPPFLAKNPKIYGVLSRGVHEMQEHEARQAYPDLLLAVREILDEALRKRALERVVKNLRS